MTIFLIARGTPSIEDPQWGCFEYDQAKALALLGHQVVVISFDGRFRCWRQLGYSVSNKDNVYIVNLRICPSIFVKIFGNRISQKWKYWQLKHAFLHAKKIFGQPDILYSHYLFMSELAIQLKAEFQIPLVALEHWSVIMTEPISHSLVKRILATYTHIDQLLSVSSALERRIFNISNIHSIVVPNILGHAFSFKTNMHTKFTIVAVGSLIPRKGYDILLQALTKINIPNDQWCINIIGKGPLFHELTMLTKKYKLDHNVNFLGQLSKEDIANQLQSSDLFVLPSRKETFGVVYIEALACGIPVIATPCGGPEEFITPHNGLLVPIDNITRLSESIEYMYYHINSYDRQAIAADCQARFSPQVITKQLTAIFEDTIANYNKA